MVAGDVEVSEAVADMTVQHKARVVVTLKQLEQWCAVTRAYVVLAHKSVYARAERHAAVPPPPCSEVDEIVARLLQYELYEAAVELCAAYGMTLVLNSLCLAIGVRRVPLGC